MGNIYVWTKISLKKLIAHGLHFQFHVVLKPSDLITMSLRLELKPHKKNSNFIDETMQLKLKSHQKTHSLLATHQHVNRTKTWSESS